MRSNRLVAWNWNFGIHWLIFESMVKYLRRVRANLVKFLLVCRGSVAVDPRHPKVSDWSLPSPLPNECSELSWPKMNRYKDQWSWTLFDFKASGIREISKLPSNIYIASLLNVLSGLVSLYTHLKPVLSFLSLLKPSWQRCFNIYVKCPNSDLSSSHWST